MKLQSNKKIIILASLVLVFLGLTISYNVRKPVLIVTDQVFFSFYGEARIRRETRIASFSLFRKMLTVPVADDAGYDTVQFAIAEISSRPHCVIFPYRFGRAAGLYHEQTPGIPIVLLEGMYGENELPIAFGSDPDEYYIYRTDIENDFFRAALAAADLDKVKNGTIVIFSDIRFQASLREAFSRASTHLERQLNTVFFTSFFQYSEISDISCVILAGAGTEFLENEENNEVPVILFSWLDTSLMPENIVLVFNDSPWTQVVSAVRMVNARTNRGLIQSKFHVLNNVNINRRALRKI